MELVLNKKTWGGMSLQVGMFFRSFVKQRDYIYTWGVGVGDLPGYTPLPRINNTQTKDQFSCFIS